MSEQPAAQKALLPELLEFIVAELAEIQVLQDRQTHEVRTLTRTHSPQGGLNMTQYRVARKTTGGQPAWEAQAREEAARLGVSEKQVKRRVEKELIRLIAEKIAQHELTWQRSPPAASRKKITRQRKNKIDK